MEHPKYQKALAALNDLIGDTSVARSTTREALDELGSVIECQLMAMDEDEED